MAIVLSKALPDALRPPKAAAYLRLVKNEKLPKEVDVSDPSYNARVTHLQLGIEDIGEMPDWSDGFFSLDSTKIAQGSAAWNRAGKALVRAGLPAYANVAYNNVQALGGEAERLESGETGGGAGIARAVADSGTQLGTAAGLGDPFDAQRAKGGSREKEGFQLITIIKWGVPVILVAGGAWYFWPILSTALQARKRAKAGLETGLDRILPAGSAARAFEPVEDVDSFASTLVVEPLQLPDPSFGVEPLQLPDYSLSANSFENSEFRDSSFDNSNFAGQAWEPPGEFEWDDE